MASEYLVDAVTVVAPEAARRYLHPDFVTGVTLTASAWKLWRIWESERGRKRARATEETISAEIAKLEAEVDELKKNNRNRMTTRNGIDVSHWQGASIDWNAVAEKASFAIIKASGGCPDPGQSVEAYTDACFLVNADRSRSAKVQSVGFYHFAYPDYNEPEDEADQFSRAMLLAGGFKPGETAWLDLERYSVKSGIGLVEWARRFLVRFEENEGFKAGIYLNKSAVESYDWKPVSDIGTPLWLAWWNDAGAAFWGEFGAFGVPSVVQYSSIGSVAGINPVDKDLMREGASIPSKPYVGTVTQSEPTAGGFTLAEAEAAKYSVTVTSKNGKSGTAVKVRTSTKVPKEGEESNEVVGKALKNGDTFFAVKKVTGDYRKYSESEQGDQWHLTFQSVKEAIADPSVKLRYVWAGATDSK